jgi:hypothetical protein
MLNFSISGIIIGSLIFSYIFLRIFSLPILNEMAMLHNYR